jgi:2-furoyl-CoA dehydrogenase large subunit
LVGNASGVLGFGGGEGIVTLSADGHSGTRLRYRYSANVGGKVAAVGQRMLGSVTRVLIGQFFRALEHRIAPNAKPAGNWLARIIRLLSGRSAP